MRLVLSLVALGSASALQAQDADVAYRPALPLPPPPPAANGAIFQPFTGYVGLYEGTRAHRVGDLVTILLVESTITSKSVRSKNDRSGSLSLIPPLSGPFAFLSPSDLKAAGAASFSGSGSAGQNSTIATALAVTIVEVWPNGTALVQGEKNMLLSQGEEWVRFRGIIRLADVDAENTVMSSRVADAYIEYSGKGALQRASRPGWLSRFFNIISPF
jgi:flagellar L-ring protein FlgH